MGCWLGKVEKRNPRTGVAGVWQTGVSVGWLAEPAPPVIGLHCMAPDRTAVWGTDN